MPINLFDADFYAAANPDLALAGLTSASQLREHFQAFGIDESRRFSPTADLSYYRQLNSDLQAVGLTSNRQLYAHLENFGIQEGRAFSRLIDIDFYLSANADLNQAFGSDREQAFSHLLTYGLAERRLFSSTLDLDFYLDRNQDVAEFYGNSGEGAFEHLVLYGIEEGRQFSQFVDLDFYLSANADLSQTFGSDREQALSHLVNYGLSEKRLFSSTLDLDFYLDTNNDVAETYQGSGKGAFEHLVVYGLDENRQFSLVYDQNEYATRNPDLASAGIDEGRELFNHFVSFGIAEGRESSPVFSINTYRNANGDLADMSNIELVQHFQTAGIAEGRRASSEFDVLYYRNENPDLASSVTSNREAFQHYLAFGSVSGRQGIPPAVADQTIQFSEVSQAAGLEYRGASFGASWGDFNGDGYMDLWRSNHYQRTAQLFLNQRDGTFRDVSEEVFINQSNLGGDPHGAAWADIDNDGDQDLIVLHGANSERGTGDPNRLYINEVDENGRRFFVDRAAAQGVDYPLGRGRTPSWFDYDNDGLLDVWVGNLARQDQQAPPNVFQQQADGSFVGVRDQIGLTIGQSDYAIMTDLDNDGQFNIISRGFDPGNDFERVNAYEINDGAACPAGCSCNFCVQNLSDDILAAAGVPDFPPDMATADFNNDLQPDVFVAHLNSEGDQLLLNQNGNLVDASDRSGILDGLGNSASVVAGDFNNDMYVDLYVMKGRSADETSNNAANVLYVNQGDGTFEKLEGAGGAMGTNQGSADVVMVADYDLDGFLDLYTVNGPTDAAQNSELHGPAQLFRNQGNGNNWVQIDLEGTTSNRDGIGAKVYVKSGGVTQLREQTNGVHNIAQDSSLLHFGLAQNQRIEEITIVWPSGEEQTISNVSVNQVLKITEPNR